MRLKSKGLVTFVLKIVTHLTIMETNQNLPTQLILISHLQQYICGSWRTKVVSKMAHAESIVSSF
jgi:hypothetical protein